MWHNTAIDFGYVCSGILWVKFKFSRVKICVVVVGYSPSEGDGEERETLWNDLERVLDKVGNGYRLIVCGRRSEWMGWRRG